MSQRSPWWPSLVEWSACALLIAACCVNPPRKEARTPPALGSLPVIRADIRIAPDTCIENPNVVNGDGQYATLDCSDGGAGAVFRVLFPRKQWHAMKQDGLGTTDAGPGK